MIRILQVVTHMNRGGLETMLMNYYRHIDREQVQFDFLTHRPYDGDYGTEIKELGGIIFHLPILNPFSSYYKRVLGDFFDDHPEYKVIHVHQDCLSSVILKVAKQHGIMVRIAHSHIAGQDVDIKYPIKLFYQRFIPCYATELMACSEDAGKWMFRGAEFQVLNNAIDVSSYVYDEKKRQQQREKWGIQSDTKVYGHVGRFSPQKNHEFLVDIFNDIVDKEANSVLLLVGNDTEENAPAIKEKVKILGLDDKVIFTGLRTDVADLLQAMDVFLFPSRCEGLGIVAIEAQASGLPCLISENVPTECKKTELVQQLSLTESSENWAKAAIKAAKETKRVDTSNQIKAAGYDIAENAKWLQEYYLKQAAEN